MILKKTRMQEIGRKFTFFKDFYGYIDVNMIASNKIVLLQCMFFLYSPDHLYNVQFEMALV